MKPSIVFVGANDWANMCHRFSEALRRRGWTAHAIIQNRHPFGYEDYPLDEETRRDLVRTADFVATSGDGDYPTFDRMMAQYGPAKPGAVFVAVHAGTAYRESPVAYDAEDSRRWWFRRVFAPDLYRLVPVKDTFRAFLIPPPWEFAKDIKPTGKPLRVLHAPSNPDRKGTALIEGALRDMAGVDYRTVKGVSNAEVKKAMEWADVFVDTLYGYEGNIGCAVAEAASLGLAVVTDFHNVPAKVREQIGVLPFFEVEGQESLKGAIEFMRHRPQMVDEWKERSLKWANEYLAPAGVERLWRGILGN